MGRATPTTSMSRGLFGNAMSIPIGNDATMKGKIPSHPTTRSDQVRKSTRPLRATIHLEPGCWRRTRTIAAHFDKYTWRQRLVTKLFTGWPLAPVSPEAISVSGLPAV